MAKISEAALAEARRQLAASGGRARAAKLTPAEQSEAGKLAVAARWAKHRAKHGDDAGRKNRKTPEK